MHDSPDSRTGPGRARTRTCNTFWSSILPRHSLFMAPSSEVSSIMEGMIFQHSSWHSFIKVRRSWHWKDMESTAKIIQCHQNDHPILYCGIIQCHQNGGLLFAFNLGLADIPIGTWAALNLLERWGKFPFSGLGGKPSGYHVSLELKQAVFIGDGCTLENYPMVVWTLHPQGSAIHYDHLGVIHDDWWPLFRCDQPTKMAARELHSC